VYHFRVFMDPFACPSFH